MCSTKSGKPVSNIRLATNCVIGGEERSQFHTIIWWDRLAETTGAYVKKGDPFYVEGRLEYRTFQDEEGNERGVCEIIASDVGFLSRRPSGDGAADTVGSGPIPEDISPDDIPFWRERGRVDQLTTRPPA